MAQLKRTPKDNGTAHQHAPLKVLRPRRLSDGRTPTTARSRFTAPPKGQVQPRFKGGRS